MAPTWRRGGRRKCMEGCILGFSILILIVGNVKGKGVSTISPAKLGRSAAGLDSLSPIKAVEEGIPRAIELAKLEQELEDINVMHKYDRRLERLAMVMPLTDLFDPGVAHFAHEHLQLSAP
ncbi:unnamed protein product [Choristocarpus tenellus]